MKSYFKMKEGDKVRVLGDFYPMQGVIVSIESLRGFGRLIRVKLVCENEEYTNFFEWEILELC